MAKLTTIGMYQYDPTLFSDLTFPAGIDKDLAVCQILNSSGEFEVLYPNPDFFKQMITFWGKKHYRTFDKWIYALGIDFEPLYNYDRFEEFVDEKLGTTATNNERTGSTIVATETERSRNAAQSMANTSDVTTGTTGDRQSVNGETVDQGAETENKVSAFDASTYSPKDKQETTSGQVTNGMQLENSKTDSSTSEESSTNSVENSSEGESITSSQGSSISDKGGESRTEQTKHTAHLYGNIGVTTSAQMLQEFLDVERFNIYEQIADLFIDEFCIMVY